MRVDAVVFDMDGLMLDTEPLYRDAWQEAASRLGYEIDDALYATFTGRSTKDCEADLLRHSGSAFPLDAFRRHWPSLWEAAAGRGIDTKPGLLELLAFLEERSLATAVATSSDAAYAALSLRHAGLGERFRVLVTADQVPRGKPAPDLFLEAARRLGVDPARCLALEDSSAGILAARAAGMTGILVPDLAEPTEAAVAAAAHVFGSLHEVRGLLATTLAEARCEPVQNARNPPCRS